MNYMLKMAMDMLGITTKDIKKRWDLYKRQGKQRATFKEFRKHYISRKLRENGAGNFIKKIRWD